MTAIVRLRAGAKVVRLVHACEPDLSCELATAGAVARWGGGGPLMTRVLLTATLADNGSPYALIETPVGEPAWVEASALSPAEEDGYVLLTAVRDATAAYGSRARSGWQELAADSLWDWLVIGIRDERISLRRFDDAAQAAYGPVYYASVLDVAVKLARELELAGAAFASTLEPIALSLSALATAASISKLLARFLRAGWVPWNGPVSAGRVARGGTFDEPASEADGDSTINEPSLVLGRVHAPEPSSDAAVAPSAFLTTSAEPGLVVRPPSPSLATDARLLGLNETGPAVPRAGILQPATAAGIASNLLGASPSRRSDRADGRAPAPQPIDAEFGSAAHPAAPAHSASEASATVLAQPAAEDAARARVDSQRGAAAHAALDAPGLPQRAEGSLRPQAEQNARAGDEMGSTPDPRMRRRAVSDPVRAVSSADAPVDQRMASQPAATVAATRQVTLHSPGIQPPLLVTQTGLVSQTESAKADALPPAKQVSTAIRVGGVPGPSVDEGAPPQVSESSPPPPPESPLGRAGQGTAPGEEAWPQRSATSVAPRPAGFQRAERHEAPVHAARGGEPVASASSGPMAPAHRIQPGKDAAEPTRLPAPAAQLPTAISAATLAATVATAAPVAITASVPAEVASPSPSRLRPELRGEQPAWSDAPESQPPVAAAGDTATHPAAPSPLLSGTRAADRAEPALAIDVAMQPQSRPTETAPASRPALHGPESTLPIGLSIGRFLRRASVPAYGTTTVGPEPHEHREAAAHQTVGTGRSVPSPARDVALPVSQLPPAQHVASSQFPLGGIRTLTASAAMDLASEQEPEAATAASVHSVVPQPGMETTRGEPAPLSVVRHDAADAAVEMASAGVAAAELSRSPGAAPTRFPRGDIRGLAASAAMAQASQQERGAATASSVASSPRMVINREAPAPLPVVRSALADQPVARPSARSATAEPAHSPSAEPVRGIAARTRAAFVPRPPLAEVRLASTDRDQQLASRSASVARDRGPLASPVPSVAGELRLSLPSGRARGSMDARLSPSPAPPPPPPEVVKEIQLGEIFVELGTRAAERAAVLSKTGSLIAAIPKPLRRQGWFL